MANNDAAFGLRPVGELGSGIQNGGTSKYKIAAGYATAIFKGDIVKLVAAGTVQVSGNADVANVGVFNGCFYNDPTTQKPTWSNYYPGAVNITTGTIDAFVYDDPNKLFEVQCDGTIAQAGIGDNANIAYTAGSTVNGQSKLEISSTLAGGTANLRIIRISEDPDNSDISSANANWIVRINEHLYYNQGAGI